MKGGSWLCPDDVVLYAPRWWKRLWHSEGLYGVDMPGKNEYNVVSGQRNRDMQGQTSRKTQSGRAIARFQQFKNLHFEGIGLMKLKMLGVLLPILSLLKHSERMAVILKVKDQVLWSTIVKRWNLSSISVPPSRSSVAQPHVCTYLKPIKQAGCWLALRNSSSLFSHAWSSHYSIRQSGMTSRTSRPMKYHLHDPSATATLKRVADIRLTQFGYFGWNPTSLRSFIWLWRWALMHFAS